MRKNGIDDTSDEKFLKNKAKRAKNATSGNRKNEKKSGLSAGKIILCIVLSLLGAIFLFISVLFINFKGCTIFMASCVDVNIDGDNKNNDVLGDKNRDYIQVDGNQEKKNYTFLATATDKAGSLTDVIMIANFTNSETKPKVSILQIPRDTFVKISSGKLIIDSDGNLSQDNFTGPSATTGIKINEVYYRGRNLAEPSISSLLEQADKKSSSQINQLCKKEEYKFLNVDTKKLTEYASTTDKALKKELANNIRRDFGLYYLQQLIFCHFNIPTDYVAQINLEGFRGIVDAIGGVDLNVPQRMYYVDPYQDLYIDLKPGYQHLDGKKAEGFVRYRQYVLGDVQRLDAQKIFFDALLDKLLSVSTISKIDDIVEQVDKHMYTSISFENMVRFANRVINIDTSTGFEMITLPGEGQYINSISYFVCDKSAAAELINKKFLVYNKPFELDEFNMIDGGSVPKPSEPVWSDDADSNVPVDDVPIDDETQTPDDTDISDDQTDTDITDNGGITNNDGGNNDDTGDGNNDSAGDGSGEGSNGDTDNGHNNGDGNTTDDGNTSDVPSDDTSHTNDSPDTSDGTDSDRQDNIGSSQGGDEVIESNNDTPMDNSYLLEQIAAA